MMEKARKVNAERA